MFPPSAISSQRNDVTQWPDSLLMDLRTNSRPHLKKHITVLFVSTTRKEKEKRERKKKTKPTIQNKTSKKESENQKNQNKKEKRKERKKKEKRRRHSWGQVGQKLLLLGNVEHICKCTVIGEYWVKKQIVVFVFTCMFYHADYYRIIVIAYDYECSQHHASFHMYVWEVSLVPPPTPTHTHSHSQRKQ